MSAPNDELHAPQAATISSIIKTLFQNFTNQMKVTQ